MDPAVFCCKSVSSGLWQCLCNGSHVSAHCLHINMSTPPLWACASFLMGVSLALLVSLFPLSKHSEDVVTAFTLKYICTVVSFTTTMLFIVHHFSPSYAISCIKFTGHTGHLNRWLILKDKCRINISEEGGGSAESSVCRRATPRVRLEHKIRSVSLN